MKLILSLAILSMATTAFAGKDVVYGDDNRLDVYQVTNALHKNLARSTAGMINIGHFVNSSQRGFFDLQQTRTLEEAKNVCPSEAFSQQHVAPNCSGFLVGPDIIVTAGHCFKTFSTPETVCRNFAWVFDYSMTSPTHNPTQNVPLENIYLCNEVLHAELSPFMDYAIIKLHRPVEGREPLKFRTSGKISNNADLVVIGHPTGLPTKVSTGGRVTWNVDSTRFSATLDTFQGNSGSAVFDAQTGQIEGILIQGKSDYRLSKKEDPNSCVVVNKCDNQGRNCEAGDEYGSVRFGEVVLRIETIADKIKAAL
jgi:V8-like Glu-specific endopeptidase